MRGGWVMAHRKDTPEPGSGTLAPVGRTLRRAAASPSGDASPEATQASGGLAFRGLEPAAAGNQAFRAIERAGDQLDPQ